MENDTRKHPFTNPGICIFILNGKGCKEYLDPNYQLRNKLTLSDSKQTLTEGKSVTC